MDSRKPPCGGWAIEQMRYAPHRRIRTESAAAKAVEIAQRVSLAGRRDEEFDETVLFVALHTCAFRATRCHARKGVNSILCRKWVCRWRRIREYIVRENLGLVYAMVARLRLGDAYSDDIVSDGLCALARAVERFDPWRGVRFSTYACNLIVRDLINQSKRAGRHRQMFPYQYDASFERPQPCPDARTSLYVERLQRVLSKNLAGLTELEFTILDQRFPSNRPKRRTLQQIGDAIGVSKERVRQIQNKALDKLREVLDADPLLQ